MSGHQIKESCFSHKIPLCKSQGLSQREYSMIQLCIIHHAFPVTLHTLEEHMVNRQCLTTMMASDRRLRDKIQDLVTLVWPIRSRVITTSTALVKCCNFFSGPSVGFNR